MNAKSGALLLLITLVGLAVQLYDIGSRPITHPEMYVPGITFPEGVSEPQQRGTVLKVVSGTFSADIHPPGYYLLMLGWTKVFGTSLISIRLPGVLFGVACIPLVFWLALLIEQRAAGWIAAVMLALSGYHVFWSQTARMYSMACFWGLLATVFLLKLSCGGRPPGWLKWGYCLALSAGALSHLFFWTIMATHLAWTVLSGLWAGRTFPGLLKLQILMLILLSPLLAFAGYQQGNPLAPMNPNVLPVVRDFLGFSFLFPNFESGFFKSAPLIVDGNTLTVVLRVACAAAGLALLWMGMIRLGSAAAQPVQPVAGPAPWTWLAAAVAASGMIATFVWTARHFLKSAVYSTLRTTEALIVLPLLIALGALALRAAWERLPAWGPPALAGRAGLVSMLAVTPFLLLTVVSLVKPIFNQRGMLPLGPYLLLVMAAGMTPLRRRRWRAAALLAALVPGFAVSLHSYHIMRADPVDYDVFANLLKRELGRDDLIFLRRRWDVTPILYYLAPGHNRFVANDFRAACQRQPGVDVWVLLLHEQEPPTEMRAALSGSGYREVHAIRQAPWLALRFVRDK